MILRQVTDHMRIARKYLAGWFWIDLFGGFPLDACFPAYWIALTTVLQASGPTGGSALVASDVESGADNSLSSVRLLKTAKLSRLFKMLKVRHQPGPTRHQPWAHVPPSLGATSLGRAIASVNSPHP